MPRIRLRSASGRWLVLHASRLRTADAEGQIAVIFEEARPSEIAPLIVDAYGLTKREGEITRLVLRGLSTAEVSNELYITPKTVRDHFKSIFDKVGVRSRRELAAGIFAQQYQARRCRHPTCRRAPGRRAAGRPNPRKRPETARR